MSTPLSGTCGDSPSSFPRSRTGVPDDAVRAFVAERAKLLRVAYRVVGDRASAEDVVQDVWLRWQRVAHDTVLNPAAFLATTTRRVAIDVVQSARHRREVSTPEPPDATAVDADPSDRAVRLAAIEQSIALLMTRLSAAELAALMLRCCFDYPYRDLATMLGTSPPSVRQLVHRARLGLAGDRARPVDGARRKRLVAAFTHASETGDLAELVELLTSSAPHQRRVAAVLVPQAA